jgi:phosphonate transport system permease protein
MTTVQTLKPKPETDVAVAPLSPEELREQLLRPLPRVTLRGAATTILTLIILAWSVQGTETSIAKLIEGGPAIWSFATRLFPPEYEFQSGTERSFISGGEEATIERLRAVDEFQPILREGQSIYVYIDDKPVPVTNQTLQRTIGNLRGQDTIRYVVGASGFTIGWPVIITSIIETIQMAIIGTLGAVLLSMPLALLAAQNVSPYPVVYQTTRFALNIMRSIPELIYALIFVAAVGLGPFPGVLAIIFGSVGSLSRIFAEAIEQIDPQQVLAVEATGAGGVQTFMFAAMPQAVPLLISYSIVYFEHNVRNATILGLVGAGGVGFEIQKYISLFQYDKLMGTVIVLVVAVTLLDRFSSYIRNRFI